MKVRLKDFNSFQSEVRGRWTRSADGRTEIRLVAGVSRFVLAFLFLLNAFGFWTAVRLGQGLLQSALACLFILAWSVALYVFGRWSTREEEETIVLVLVRALRCDPPAPDA